MSVSHTQKLFPSVVRFGLLLLLVWPVSGCGKKSNHATLPSPANETVVAPSAPASAVPSQPGSPRGIPPQAVPPAPASLAASSSADEAAAQMSMELRKYVLYTRTIPNSFDDFVAHHPMRYPVPPAGKRYVIENGKVVVR